MYRRKHSHFRKRKRTRKLQRYGKYVATLNYQNELKEARGELVDVFNAIIDKKISDYWKESLKLLYAMEQELKDMGEVPYQPVDIMKYCVKIFDIASRYQDALNGELKICPEEKKELLITFNNNLYFSGRHEVDDLRPDSEYGPLPYWNTTEPGEPITMENICFGPELGLPRRPASYWVSLSKKKKVGLTQITTYSKGYVNKRVSVWVTDALVRIGIKKFCKTAHENLLQNLADLLEGETF